ncbi:MAG: Mur ligase family protein [Bacteroidales bacterium]|jgi:UDP-N-acetylmuramate: L-alanyl-gamma-D-glutamyl-meso-diaminopimelate ligase|nr:Mur ligase family protein [Bacteroidales bacterium]
MKVHFIAIGGSAMHNLAISLHNKGYIVTGSDDEIFEPSRSRLANIGILPLSLGWFPEKITTDLDAIILGMHARNDNPELVRARKLNLKIYSYPEYLYEQTKEKIRVVIGGSHGKTTITSMIMHVLKFNNRKFDYMVGAQIEGFDTMVSLTEDAPIAVFEGDEYLSSTLDPRPKFHLYKPNIALISGIAWDHINVFPTFENYCEQFKIFIDKIEPNGTLIYFSEDPIIKNLSERANSSITKTGYSIHPSVKEKEITYLLTHNKKVPLHVFGDHNLQNISGAKLVCNNLGISDSDFYEAISDFKGASKRIELLAENNNTKIFRDFAHSPSKLKATINAVKNQFSEKKLIAVMELHTFSSLSAAFLDEYKGTMDLADISIVYYNPEVIAHKKLKAISIDMVKNSFSNPLLKVFDNQKELIEEIHQLDINDNIVLFMSSGNFSGIELKDFASDLIISDR